MSREALVQELARHRVNDYYSPESGRMAYCSCTHVKWAVPVRDSADEADWFDHHVAQSLTSAGLVSH